MKKLCLVLVGLLLAAPLWAAIPAGYVSYWKMDGNLNDETGLNNGTIMGGTAVYGEGIKGRGIQLNSSALYVDLGTNASLNFSGSFSIGGWVFCTAGGSYQKIVDKSTWNSGFYIQQGGNWPGHWMIGFVGRESAMDTTGLPAYTNQWAHVMGVYDSAASTMSLYINGQLKHDTASAGMVASAASLKFGKINGLVDEMVYYNRALSDTEVAGLMAATRDTTAPVISGIAADILPAFNAEITFRTNMLASSAVEYGKETTACATYFEHAADTLHHVRINGLNNGRVFHYRVHAWNLQGYESVSPWCSLSVAAVPLLQKMGLARGPQVAAPADLVWPTAVGQADVCLWADDKLAATTITIDDNQANNWAWWLGQADTLPGLRFTWFAITSGIATINGGNSGTWSGFRDLFARGHAVQSHTETHASNAPHTGGTLSWAEDYGRAKAILEDSIPGNQCLTMAYPGGGFANNTDTAAMFYAGIRSGGSPPHPIPATGINYLGNNSVEGLDSTFILSVLNKTTLSAGANYRRGWTCFYFHYLNTVDYLPTHNYLHFIKTHEDSLWITTYLDLIKYAQERDTKTLTVNSVTSDLISFTLTDSMMDTLFNYPLTIKVRLDNSWDSCSAQQNGNPVAATMVTYAGNKYALVRAVPDRGQVQLINAASTTVRPAGQAVVVMPAAARVVVYGTDGKQVAAGRSRAEALRSVPTGVYLIGAEGAGKLVKQLIVR